MYLHLIRIFLMGCSFMEAIVYYFIIYSFIYIFRSEMVGKG